MPFALRIKLVSFLALMAMLALASALPGGGAAAQAGDAAPAAAAAPRFVSAQQAIDRLTSADGQLRFDVAEDMTKFAVAPAPRDDDGLPVYGNAFVTQGYIYPYGTLSGGNGVLADGSPEFPDKVLGKWVCRGWFVGDFATTTTGEIVVTTQVYTFGSGFDTAMLVTDGFELADVDKQIERAITGGTGPYANAGGEGRQILLGLNASEGVNLRYELDVQTS
jgi:hypothetical protein